MDKRMTYATMKRQVRLVLCLSLLGLGLLTSWGAQAVAQDSPALKLIYSDWPGWVTWEIAKQKDFFALEGVAVELLWMDYVAGMEAFAAGQADAVCMTNGDALVTGAASGKPSTAIILNDYSNGNDMVVGRPGIESLSDLKGLRVGVEVGFVGHLLLTALEAHGMTEHDVTLVNIPTNELPQALAAGSVDAITAWQPNSGQALKVVPGSKRLYSSADSPGIIYDLLYVSHESLAARRDDWAKVVRVWYRIVAFMQDPANRAEMLEILSARVGLPPDEYAPFLDGTHILPLDEAVPIWQADESAGLKSLKGSNVYVDTFNVRYGVYPQAETRESYFDPSFTLALQQQK